MDRLVDDFDNRLSAVRLGYSTVIEISFSAGSAERSAQIANTIANTYVADQLNAKLEANRTATAWLQDRLKELGQQALTAERAVDTFKSENNIVAAGGKLMDEEQVADLNRRIVAARTQTSDASARLNRLETVLATNSADSASIGNLDASGSDVLSSPIITTLRQQYFEYARREFEYSAKYGADHLAVVTLRTAMKGIRASILEEVRRLAEAARNDFEVAKQRQRDIENQLSQAVSQSRTTNSAELTMRELESGAKGYRSLYESFLQRYMGSVQQETVSHIGREGDLARRASAEQEQTQERTDIGDGHLRRDCAWRGLWISERYYGQRFSNVRAARGGIAVPLSVAGAVAEKS